MARHREGDLCNLPYIQHVTGVNAKTLWAWIDRKRLLPLESPKFRRGHVFSWPDVRPRLVELTKGMPDVNPSDWPD